MTTAGLYMSAERLIGKRSVTHSQFQLLCTGESSISLPLPNALAVDQNLKDTSGTWPENHLIQIVAEAGEQFLRHPH
jgi:hypothetical protein